MTWSPLVTFSLSLLCLLLILYWYHRAKKHALALAEHEQILLASYRKQEGGAYISPLQHLLSQGWRASAHLSRRDMIAHWRARAQTDKQRLASYIEMMPQLGLLGTVLSLSLAATLFDFNMTMLGLALITTMLGLLGALIARLRLEHPSEERYHNILELLQHEDVVDRLIHFTEISEKAKTDTSPPNDKYKKDDEDAKNSEKGNVSQPTATKNRPETDPPENSGSKGNVTQPTPTKNRPPEENRPPEDEEKSKGDKTTGDNPSPPTSESTATPQTQDD